MDYILITSYTYTTYVTLQLNMDYIHITIIIFRLHYTSAHEHNEGRFYPNTSTCSALAPKLLD
jgi:hypothetical protein